MKIARNQQFLNFDPPAAWEIDPELYVFHQLFDERPEIVRLAVPCFPNATEEGVGFMGCDGMTVEQVVRAAIYKQYNRLTYRELAKHTADSILGRQFMKMEYGQHFSHQTLQENIALLTPAVLIEIMQAINSAALEMEIDDGQKIRSDATCIETDIHYPTDASLLWDCIRVGCRLMEQVADTVPGFPFRDCRKGAKRLLFKINNCRDKKKRKKLYRRLFKISRTCRNQVDERLALAAGMGLLMSKLLFELCTLRSQMAQVEDVARRRHLDGESVPVEDKILSIFEPHTDCIVKGSREAIFGHKINLATGTSGLIFDCQLEQGNWSEKVEFVPMLERIADTYRFVPRDVTVDGGPASGSNLKKALALGVKNVVFGKTVGSLQNHVSSKAMETRLKKWRAGVEAHISNFKRGLRAARCTWKGWSGFQRFTLLNVIVFNLKVIATRLLSQL